MIKNTSISRCLKSDFVAFQDFGGNNYKLKWGKKDELHRVSVLNKESGEYEYTGEVKETGYCTYESVLYRGVLTPYLLDSNVFSIAKRQPSLAELKEMYEGLGLTEEQMLPLLKEKLKGFIRRYDKSEYVEDFTIGGIHLWLDHDLRGKVKENLETCQSLGETETILRFNGLSFPITVELGWKMYYAVLAYARDCWNVTENHLSVVDGLVNIDELLAYDYKVGYPKKLSF